MPLIETKYKQIPSPEKSNWVLVSMGDIARIKKYLTDFPTQKNFEESKESEDLNFINISTTQKACSSTLIWSGTIGNNTPIKLYGDHPVGFTLDPEKITLPHAEFFACRTGSVVPKEFEKKNFNLNTYHPGKPVRIDEFKNEKKLVTNYAKYDPISGICYLEGSVEVFSHSVWYKYHKKFSTKLEEVEPAKIADLNEGLVLGKKTGENPINGIIIRAEFFRKITDTEKQELINILIRNPNFKLLIYDPTLKEDIMREIIGLENKIRFLLKIVLTNDDVNQLKPFKGFLSEQATPSSELSTTTKLFEILKQIDFLSNFSLFDTATSDMKNDTPMTDLLIKKRANLSEPSCREKPKL